VKGLLRELHWQFVTKTLWLLFTVCARVRVLRLAPVPRHGGFILAANHISHFDPPLFTVTTPRRIDWIAMVELFHGRFFHTFFDGLNVIPVDRSGTDRTALRTAVKRLEAGRVVGIFPEGGIRDGAASIVNGAPMKSGVALLSVMANAPILPCVILGSDRFYNKRSWRPWRPAPVWIATGELIVPPPDRTGAALRAHMQDTLATALVSLKDRLCAEFALTADDLPKPPKERMAA
jgi:1-acyl-sn-glycerol-3-phosphate acyltransferase